MTLCPWITTRCEERVEPLSSTSLNFELLLAACNGCHGESTEKIGISATRAKKSSAFDKHLKFISQVSLKFISQVSDHPSFAPLYAVRFLWIRLDRITTFRSLYNAPVLVDLIH